MGSELTQLHTERPGLRLFHADAFALLGSLEADSVDLLLTDPPYYRVKEDDWDRQWATDAEFLAWMGSLCEQWRRVLKPNGSLYVFASPEMAGRVECMVREQFQVLNHLVWLKPDDNGSRRHEAQLVAKGLERTYYPGTERIIFAEQYGCDERAGEISGYFSQCEAAKRSVLGDYLAAEIERAGVSRKDIAALFPSATGNLTGCVSNWVLGLNWPTEQQYVAIRDYLNGCNCTRDYLNRNYAELTATAQGLRREFNDLRQQYEDLRRPFFATPDAPYTDVWEFPTVPAYPGKHPCEKPQELLRHIVTTSSRPGATVLDCFMGSGSTGEAALSLGREFIGGDASPHWSQYACARLERRFGALPPKNAHKKPQRARQGEQSSLWEALADA